MPSPPHDAHAPSPGKRPNSRRETKQRSGTEWILLVGGWVTVANALWMLAGPMHWYQELPAAVPDTGPFNPHFVRDIGCAFLTTGIALLWAERNPAYRFPLTAVAAFFLAAHALLHGYDTLRGALGHNHWLLDLPGVYLPGVILSVIAWQMRPRKAELT